MAKPDAIKGPSRRRGGCARKVAGLTSGGLYGCLGCPLATRAIAGWWDGGVREDAVRCGEVSRGHMTGGGQYRRKGPNAKPSDRTFVLVGRFDRSQLLRGLGGEGPRVKPKDARPERSGSPAPDDTSAHPAEASLWEQFLARENLAEALRRVERTPVPLVSTG
jgi:hypothetical protein